LAKIANENIIISISKLVKDSESANLDSVNEDTLTTIEQVVQELLGDGLIVEVSK
jgi:hypothetical protein